MTTRRVFLQTLGSAAAAGRLLGQVPEPAPRKIGFAIVGLGRISLNQFLPGLKLAQRARVAALVSGHRDKAEKTAELYGVPAKSIYDYGQFEALAENPEVDAVYIALPNGMHAEYTIRAARAGKHVLCEKPMANSAADCQQMIAACRQARRKLMIAYRCQLQPTHLRAIRMVREGAIGELRFLEATLGFNIAKGEWRLNRKLAGGGPLMDVGIYCLQACRYLAGEEPAQLSASMSVSTQDGRFTEVEENLFWNMRFPSGVVAACSTSYGSSAGNFFRAVGTRGWVLMEPAYSYEGLRLKARLQEGQEIDEAAGDPAPRQFTREADHFAECILDGKEPKMPGEEGLRDMRLIEAIYRSAAADRPLKV